jgi:hypothetical protein
MSLLHEEEHLATQMHDADWQAAALRVQSQCWYQLDQWNRVIENEVKWRALEEQHPKFRERVDVMCFQIALAASVYARRGEFDRAAALREESYSLMLTRYGSLENWGRDSHY